MAQRLLMARAFATAMAKLCLVEEARVPMLGLGAARRLQWQDHPDLLVAACSVWPYHGPDPEEGANLVRDKAMALDTTWMTSFPS